MYSIEDVMDAFKKFLDGSNDEEVKTLMVEYIGNVRQQIQKEKEIASKLFGTVPDTVVFDDIVGYILEYRPPEEIKKDIKHEKNPMRLKQLNQELNESYKYYKRTKKND